MDGLSPLSHGSSAGAQDKTSLKEGDSEGSQEPSTRSTNCQALLLHRINQGQRASFKK